MNPQMNTKSDSNSFQQYVIKVADYIEMEYGGFDSDTVMTDDEKYTVRNILTAYHETNDSINNAANSVMIYLRKNKVWKENN